MSDTYLDSLLSKDDFIAPKISSLLDRLRKSKNLAKTYKALCWFKHCHNIGNISAKELSNVTGIGYCYQYQILQDLEGLEVVKRLGKRARWAFTSIDKECLEIASRTLEGKA